MPALLLLAGALLAGHGLAASPPLLSLETYGLDEGLSQLSVTAMASDDQGFLWVATQEGLNRFDGHRFRTYRSGAAGTQDPYTLLSSSVDSLAFEPSATRLWLGSNDAGLEVIALRDWHHQRIGVAQGLSDSRVGAILLDPAGGAWLGTGAGVDHVDATLRTVRRLGASAAVVGLAMPNGQSQRPLALDEQCQLARVDADALQALPGFGAHACLALQAGPEGLWVLAADAGLFLLDPHGAVRGHWDRGALGVGAAPSALARLDDGRLLLGFDNGQVLVRQRDGRLQPLRFEQPLDSAITAFHQDAAGGWWVGTYTSGLARVRPLVAVIPGDALDSGTMAGWPNHSVRAIWKDAQTALLGTDSGLMRRDAHQPWQPVAALRGLSVRAIRRDGEGWWIGTMDGLFRLDAVGRAQRIAGLPDPRISDLLVDGDTLWVATRGGLARLHAGSVVAEPRAAPLAGTLVTSLFRDDDGTLWIGTNAAGLWRLPAADTAHPVHPGGAGMHTSVWAIHGDAQALWLGTFSGGLYRLDRRSGDSQQLTDRDGLANNVVYRIQADATGRLWLSTNNGIGVYDPGSGINQRLGRRDGLRNREYNSGASYADGDGRLYFGGTQGLDALVPAALPRRSAPARPVLTAAQVVDHARNAGLPNDIVYADAIALPSEDSVLTLDMTAIDFLAPSAARLRYRVQGLHTDWIYPLQARQEISLNHLPAGHYRLEVAAAGRDGRFGPARVLRIDVPPPLWRHPLAYALYALALLLTAALVAARVRHAMRREREQVELLNRTVTERTAQLRTANEQLLRSNARLDLATRTDPLTQVANRRELQHWLGHAGPQLLAQRSGSAATHDLLFFFMVDIDNFKRINDGHGHQTGDQVLVAFAGRLRALCREHDLLVRWGGEEFLLVARLAHERAAASLAERIRRSVCGDPVQLDDGDTLPVTCSIGFAPWPLSPRWPALGDWEQSTALADRCLYAAKGAGKNAWVGLVLQPAHDRLAVQALLAGEDPLALGDGVACLHSTTDAPHFDH